MVPPLGSHCQLICELIANCTQVCRFWQLRRQQVAVHCRCVSSALLLLLLLRLAVVGLDFLQQASGAACAAAAAAAAWSWQEGQPHHCDSLVQPFSQPLELMQLLGIHALQADTEASDTTAAAVLGEEGNPPPR